MLQTKETSKSWAIIDLQGKLDCEFVIGYYFSPKAQRANLTDRWPSSPEENLERLANCGIPDDRRVMMCSTCGGKKRSRIPKVSKVELTFPLLRTRSWLQELYRRGSNNRTCRGQMCQLSGDRSPCSRLPSCSQGQIRLSQLRVSFSRLHSCIRC
jgi:hypothetical protein